MKRAKTEDAKERRARARKILARIKKEFPQAQTEIGFRNPFELLVATILSAQSTDVTVNKVTPGLFKKYPNPRAFAHARRATLEKEIRSTGFFRMKTRAIIEASQDLVDRHGGEVPRDLESLTQLPGVGRKTANVILASAFGEPAIIVDTHMKRCANRLGLSENQDPDKIEFDLQALLPKKDWSPFSHSMVLHGRYVCMAKKPQCPDCRLLDLCPSAATLNPEPEPRGEGRDSRN